MTDKVGRPELPRMSRSEVDAIVQRVARPEKRSPLFWWLLEHHDALCEAGVEGGLGLQWETMCSDFAAKGITALGGKVVTPGTARITWQRVRKERKRVEERRAQELADREARRAADPRRNMPSRFPKGDYGPPLATHQPQPAPSGGRALAPLTVCMSRDEQRDRGLQLSTADGVVITKISRVYKLPGADVDFEFDEDGMIRGGVGWSGALESKQLMNKRSGRPINDDTEHMYAKLKLEIEKL